jgi:hypothetical protein
LPGELQESRREFRTFVVSSEQDLEVVDIVHLILRHEAVAKVVHGDCIPQVFTFGCRDQKHQSQNDDLPTAHHLLNIIPESPNNRDR